MLSGGGTIQDGFRLYGGSSGSTIRGFAITGFTNDAIDIAGSNNNLIVGNYLGLAADGSTVVANANGVNIWQGSGNVIGGSSSLDRNVISGNTNFGIGISSTGATNNIIRGNYIGTDATGELDRGNAGLGVWLGAGADNTTIGGLAAGQGNVISGNNGTGIYVGANNATIQGNYVGVNATGNASVANNNFGINVGPNVTAAVIGGTAVGAGNVISGNLNAGVLFEVGSTGVIQGNRIGVNAAGSSTINGIGAAVFLATSGGVTVGGTGVGAGNIISGSDRSWAIPSLEMPG